MIVRGQALSGVQIRGIDPSLEASVSDVGKQMVNGDIDALKPGSYSIVLGNQLAASLGVRVGDTVLVLAPQGSISPAGFAPPIDRKSVVEGKSVPVRVTLGGRRIIKKKKAKIR